jgi:endonuclease/exonuclease/phosphatase family metal-dependent hydrolase
VTDSVRIMTWNIHGAVDRNPRFDLRRVVEIAAKWKADIVALQEVDSRRAKALGADPFAVLQAELGAHGIGARSITTADGDYGQMLISRWPVTASEVHDISYGEREPRRAIEAEITSPAGAIRIIATHLGLSLHERRSQAQALMTIAGQAGATTVVVGDFNDWFWPGSVRRSLAREFPGRTRHRTFPSFCPMLRLDRIYCRPRAAFQRGFTDREARHISDHLPVIADVKV